MTFCHKPISMKYNEKGRMMSNTYCMRPLGHGGECNPQKQPEDSVTASQPLTSESKADKL